MKYSWSVSESFLAVPRPKDCKTKWYGQRAFRYISPLPNRMPCPGTSWRQTLFILSGPLSRHTSFIACNSPSSLSLLCLCGWLCVCVACVCLCVCVCPCELNLLCFLQCADVKLYMFLSPQPLRCEHVCIFLCGSFYAIYKLSTIPGLPLMHICASLMHYSPNAPL